MDDSFIDRRTAGSNSLPYRFMMIAVHRYDDQAAVLQIIEQAFLQDPERVVEAVQRFIKDQAAEALPNRVHAIVAAFKAGCGIATGGQLQGLL